MQPVEVCLVVGLLTVGFEKTGSLTGTHSSIYLLLVGIVLLLNGHTLACGSGKSNT
jgi:hypothetical protein